MLSIAHSYRILSKLDGWVGVEFQIHGL